MKTITQSEFIAYLNEVPIAPQDLRSNGGRIPDRVESDRTYGEWMKRNDPIAFNVGFQEFKRERQGHL